MGKRIELVMVVVLTLGAACDDAKKAIGEICSNNTDCADTICHSGICVSQNPLTNGAPCDNDGFCKSLSCSGGVCAQGTKATGAECRHEEECADQSCQGGVCGGAANAGSVDILFVIDNSLSMAEEQANIGQQVALLISALEDKAGKLPDLHIGVISTDLGAGTYTLKGCEQQGGDGGKLQSTAGISGCKTPAQPYITHKDGVTNVGSSSSSDGPSRQVSDALECIALLGTNGCGFQQSLQATRLALDPKNNVNPGFLRKDARLAVVIVTDGDDCSAVKTELYDPNQTATFGPLNLRCSKFGVECDSSTGKEVCKPAFDYLYAIDEYVTFFSKLKPTDKLVVAAIAGPVDPYVDPSCTSSMGQASPAVRTKALVDGLAAKGYMAFFNEGLDTSGKKTSLNICSNDFSNLWRRLIQNITAATK